MKQNNFNFLRFYFAFVVVIGHLIGISKIEVFQKFAPYFNTYISVTAFFCISGFLITGSYLNTPFLKDYFAKRAARLLPAYLFVVVTCAIFLSFISIYPFVEYFTHPQFFKYLAANLSFLNFLQPALPGVFLRNGLAFPVNGALWTLKVEVSFYLALPIILYFVQKVKRKYILFIGIYLFSMGYNYFFQELSEIKGNDFYNMLARQLPGFLSYFVCGIALYYYFEVFQRFKKWLFAVGIIIFFIEHKMGLEILTPIALSIIVFTIAFSLKQLNSFAKHGDISYGIYIFHFPIINLAIYFGFFERYNPFVVGFTVIIIILMIGYASWHIIEKPFLKRSHSVRVVD